MNFSILDALGTICNSALEWNARLDKLNGRIANRQLELARFTEKDRLPARSLKNKDSISGNPSNADDAQIDPFDSTNLHENGSAAPAPRLSSSTTSRKLGMASILPLGSRLVSPINPFSKRRSQLWLLCHTSPLSPISPSTVSAHSGSCILQLGPCAKHSYSHQTMEAISNPRLSPGGGLTRQPSQQVPSPQPRAVPAVTRKRKTESLASGESKAPKHKTRSMIIVYYDSTVQTAFEDLVKFVSASRHDMRKGKMAAMMAEMRRAAELEVNTDEDNDDVDGGVDGLQSLSPGNTMAADSDNGDADIPTPELEYLSTMHMKPLQDMAQKADALGYRRAGIDTTPGFFDEIDKALESCQGQCEHAAHQFLRDGDFSTEMDKIKQKLEEVKKSAEQEMERIREVEAANPTLPNWRSDAGSGDSSLVLKAPLTRELGLEAMKHLEVDRDVEDEEFQPKLVFKRAADVGSS